MTDKKEIRQEILKKRSNLSIEDVKAKSSAIITRLMRLKQFHHAEIIMCYMDFRNEVMTGELISESIFLGKRIAVPKTYKTSSSNSILEAVEIKGCDSGLEKCTFGILEPKEGTGKKIEPFEIDMVIVPGVAFDMKLNRIGYGAGYYDRFLTLVRPDCLKIALAFDVQVVPELPKEDTDIPMDLIITESKIIY